MLDLGWVVPVLEEVEEVSNISSIEPICFTIILYDLFN